MTGSHRGHAAGPTLDDPLAEYLRRLDSGPVGLQLLACREALTREVPTGAPPSRARSRAFSAPRLSFSTLDRAGTLGLVAPQVELAGRHRTADASAASALAGLTRRLDRICGLATPWSCYDSVLERLLPAEAPGSAAPLVSVAVGFTAHARASLRLTTRHARWDTPAGHRLAEQVARRCGHRDTEALSRLLAAPADSRRLLGMSVRFGSGRAHRAALHLAGASLQDLTAHTGTRWAADRLDDFVSRFRRVSYEVELPSAAGGPFVLTAAVECPPTGDPADFGALDRLLHALRLHPVGLRLCEDLLEGPPDALRLSVTTDARTSVTVEARPAPPRPAVGPVRFAGNAPSWSAAVRRAARYLLDAQCGGGGWWDLAVSAGASGAWLSAVVGLALGSVPPGLVDPPADLPGALERCADYLRSVELPGGWAWNEALDPDCDSTAHAVLFLHAHGGGVAPATLAALTGFQSPTGEFLTYRDAPPGHSWGRVHHDVHPAAVRALAAVRGPADSSVAAGLATMTAGLELNPPWPAFWWRTTVYGAYVTLLCLADLDLLTRLPPAARERVAAHLRTSDPLETALGCSVAALLGLDSRPRFAARLLRTQRADGSWQSTPALRVVAAGCAEPWRPELAAAAGPVYAETRRIFSTAMALTALLRSGPGR
ncbi:hypothetical protein [Kitasatospora sp. NPDC004531]